MARATLRFGARSIFEATDLRIEGDDRIGLVGPNGSGKTSLLRVIAGEQELDAGALHVTRGIRIGYLPQDIAVEGGAKLIDFVLGSVPGRTALAEEIEAADIGEEPSLRYADYAQWQRAVLSDEVGMEPHMQYWCEVLGGELPVLEL